MNENEKPPGWNIWSLWVASIQLALDLTLWISSF